MDIVLVRENTEGFYASRSMYAGSGEFMPDPDSAFSFRKITRSASARVAKVAFEMARRRRRKVSVIHKANVLKVSDGLFLEAVRSVADDYTDVELEELLVDAAAALLVREPSRFDVMLTTNMFGDILSNEAAELSGGLGMAPSLNIGMRSAMAQACHGSAPDIAGINRANPTGLMLSVAMLLPLTRLWRIRRHAHVIYRGPLERGNSVRLSRPTCEPESIPNGERKRRAVQARVCGQPSRVRLWL
jgi:3-isopropylmalate dehydrogenase